MNSEVNQEIRAHKKTCKTKRLTLLESSVLQEGITEMCEVSEARHFACDFDALLGRVFLQIPGQTFSIEVVQDGPQNCLWQTA